MKLLVAVGVVSLSGYLAAIVAVRKIDEALREAFTYTGRFPL